ncbi:MAG: diguanylate phosphodiesterase [Proteobacteria bacterium]|nr:diguanylate phosphodiesterase [Pseudomonadota bacterium]
MNESNTAEEGLKIVSLFDQGKKFTEELLKENERLRQVVRNLMDEKRELTNKFGQENTLRSEEKIRLLENELEHLKRQIEAEKKEAASTEEENREFAERYVHVERQNSDLINMYVASYQLHSTLDYEEVLTIVKDITINMIGGEIFGIYLIDRPANELILAAHEGLEGREDEKIQIDNHVKAKIYESGIAYLTDPKVQENREDKPMAYIPLKLNEEPIYVIIVYKMLIQKGGFGAVDLELVELLGKHAATAIYSARLHSISERKRSTLEGFVDMMKADIETPLSKD